MSNADFVPPARARDSDEKQTKLSPEQLHQLGLVHLNNGTLHGMTNALGSKNICAAAFWLSTVAGALIIQSVHMFFLLSSAVNSNTVTSIKYK